MPERRLESDEFEALAVDLLNANRTLRFRARGGSMYPFIRNDDIIEIELAKPDHLKRGDVVLCRLENGRLVVHRIVRLREKAVLVQGDARAMPDGWVFFPQILGKASALERDLRRIRLDSPWLSAAGKLWAVLTPLRWRLMKWFHLL